MEIRNFDAYSPLHKSGHTSKGDQLKWKIDDRWYKADYMGYEGLSQVLVSDLLQKSTCPFPFVEYDAGLFQFGFSESKSGSDSAGKIVSSIYR